MATGSVSLPKVERGDIGRQEGLKAMTDTTQFENRIADLKEQTQAVQAEMETICRAFLAAIERFAAQWFGEQVQQARENRPEVILEMSIDAVCQLKARLQQLNEQLPQLVSVAVNDSEYWVHRGEFHKHPPTPAPGGAIVRSTSTLRRPQDLDRAVRCLLGHLGAILLDCRLVEAGKEWDTQTTPPRFTAAYDWSDTMNTAIQRYIVQYEKLARLHDQVTELTRRKNQILADSKWENA